MSPTSETDRVLEHLVFEIAKGVIGETGEAFFRLLVRHLASALDADYVFVGALRPGGERVATLAAYGLGETAPGEYKLEATPSAQVVQNQICSFPEGVQRLFPEDVVLAAVGVEGYVGASMTDANGRCLGLICALTRRPMRNAKLAEALLKIFAARAGSELERKNYEDALALNEERFRALAEHGNEAVMWFKLEQPVPTDLP
jgi:formate hydrogenlyase transcriptional activator